MAVGIAAVTLVAFFAANYLGLISPEPGPLHMPSTAMAGTIAAGGSTVTAAFRLNETDVDGPIELRAAAAVGVDETVEAGVPQILVCRTEEHVCLSSYTPRQWPPRFSVPEPVEGHVVDGNRGTRTVIGVPVTLPKGPGRYRVRGIRIDYEMGGRRYRAEVGPNLVFVVRD